MPPEMTPKDIEVIVEALSAMVERTPTSELSKKIFHEGPDSYSVPELLDEVQRQTPFGKRHAQNYVNAAAELDINLPQYFDIKPQE